MYVYTFVYIAIDFLAFIGERAKIKWYLKNNENTWHMVLNTIPLSQETSLLAEIPGLEHESMWHWIAGCFP
jgi:hypothetical protein